MKDKIVLALSLLFALFLMLCFDEDTQQSASLFIDWIGCIYLVILLAPTAIFAVYAAVRAYKKSNDPSKREYLKVMLITGGILAAFFVLMLLIL